VREEGVVGTLQEVAEGEEAAAGKQAWDGFLRTSKGGGKKV
jgi:hypothetical protein